MLYFVICQKCIAQISITFRLLVFVWRRRAVRFIAYSFGGDLVGAAKTNSTARNQLIDGASDNRAIKDAVGDSVSDAPGVGNAIGLVAGIAAGIAFTYATKIYVNDNGKNITDEVKNYLYDIAGVN